jgi:hypothetical protein
MWNPLGNEANNGTMEWRASPLERGTFDILVTCLTTMILCVWTAIHPNIPGQGESKNVFRRKIWWVVLGAVAPEMVRAHTQLHLKITQVEERHPLC